MRGSSPEPRLSRSQQGARAAPERGDLGEQQGGRKQRRGKEEDFLSEKTALRYLEPALTWAFIPGSPLTLNFFLLSMARPPPAPLPAPGGGRRREGGGFWVSFREPQDLRGHCSPWGTPRPTGFCSPRPVPAAALRTRAVQFYRARCVHNNSPFM